MGGIAMSYTASIKLSFNEFLPELKNETHTSYTTTTNHPLYLIHPPYLAEEAFCIRVVAG